MATININFDVKSIKQAIKQVKEVQKKLQGKTIEVFLKKCAIWVRNRADEWLDTIEMDSRVIGDIKSSWGEPKVVGNIVRMENTSKKAVFVEFGVGYVGGFVESPHPNARETNYNYNVKSDYKDNNGAWTFKVDEGIGIDLVVDFYNPPDKNGFVTTQGSPANLYLYNALMDLQSERAYEKLWQESLKQTI